MNKLHHQIAFSFIKGMNATRAQILIEQVDDIDIIFKNPSLALKGIKKSEDFLSKEILEQAMRLAEKEMIQIEKKGIEPIFFTDKKYPFRLKECKDFPLLLFSLGKQALNRGKILSIVGTRKCSHYGMDQTNHLVESLAEKIPDLLIVSGLAYGIDIAAHKACLKFGLKTVGVLAHGLSTVYPSQHRDIANQMEQGGGALLSEFHYEERAERYNFVKRNRIIAGMSDATLVIESADKGGALITAHLAHSYNRDVLAVPGRIGDNYSKGCNKLIKTNIASLIENSDDLCKALNWDYEQKQKNSSGQLFYEPSELESDIMEHLVLNKEMSMNELARITELPLGKLSSTLLNMEFNNLVKSLPGNRYKQA